MSETKHTPGPWEVSSSVTDYNAVGQETGIGLKIQSAGPDHRWHVAIVYGQREESEPLACRHGYQSANARLIASAPELLAALQFVQKYADMKASKMEDLPEQLTRAVNQAIAKATGKDGR
jgi:hypothetical protein